MVRFINGTMGYLEASREALTESHGEVLGTGLYIGKFFLAAIFAFVVGGFFFDSYGRG